MNGLSGLAGFLVYRGNLAGDFDRRLGGVFRQLAYFIGDDCEAAPLFAGACRLNRRVEREQVGPDRLLQTVIPMLPDVDVTVGFLPLGPSLIGSLLGIPSGSKAVDVIAARLVERLDLAQVNGRPFLLEVTAPNTIAGIDVGGDYRLRPSVRGAIAIRNLAGGGASGIAANPMDGELEIVLQAESQEGRGWVWKKKVLTETKVFLKAGTMHAEQPFQVFIDGEAFMGTTFAFSVLPNKLKLITGRRLSD
jgi:hypothetical protein